MLFAFNSSKWIYVCIAFLEIDSREYLGVYSMDTIIQVFRTHKTDLWSVYMVLSNNTILDGFPKNIYRVLGHNPKTNVFLLQIICLH